jgi:NADH:ubiquinone oxidoreductase subunit F (NADH-binding)/NADH:ubiquinone oxidoreductase subunit E
LAGRRGEASILAALTQLQEREGWLPEPALRQVAESLGVPLHRIESVSTFYTHFRRTPPRRVELALCRDLPCWLAGAGEAAERLRKRLAGRDDVELRPVSCLGRCDRAPAAALRDSPFALDDAAALERALQSVEPEPAPAPARRWAADPYNDASQHYSALDAARGGTPRELIAELERSGLRGMGGAAFPTGRKWALVAAEPAEPRYVICNADESEPGTFKDRQILADLPHLVVEGIALAAHCVGARRAWVFVRHEYAPERRALEAEIARARAAGALGDLELDVFVSPGGYILGEETALLECMEDRRGEPRNKPPFPGSTGLFGQPTLINNVETFAHAAAILQRGADWWRGLGRAGHVGHKFLAVSGDVARPQVVLAPMGTPLGEILEQCGGVKDGRALAALAPGGASSRFLGPEALALPLDFDAIARAGSMLGSGALVAVAEGRDLLEVGLNVTRFFANESCGKCVPCRVGTHKAVQLVEERGITPETRALLAQLDQTLARTSICGLGQVALGPLRSLLERGAAP